MNQMEKNTVSSANQLKKSQFVTYINENGKGKRVMFVGNSITRHGVKEDIGWYGDFGMAASAEENDYVHILAKRISEKTPDPAFCICQAASWEREYKNGAETFELFEEARAFGADIIVMRIIENCPAADFDGELFRKNYKEFIDYLNPNGNAEVIVTSGFWKHPGDAALKSVAGENSYAFAYLGDLGELDEMKAIGLFEHGGVANHPGDLGMKAIADMIEEKMTLN